MSVKTTQLHGMKAMIYGWIDILSDWEEYQEEDVNPIYELLSHLENALDEINYTLRIVT